MGSAWSVLLTDIPPTNPPERMEISKYSMNEENDWKGDYGCPSLSLPIQPPAWDSICKPKAGDADHLDGVFDDSWNPGDGDLDLGGPI